MLLPAAIRRAFHIMKGRALATFADTPVAFFAVVIGVALTFRVGAGLVREAKAPPELAKTVVTGPEPGLAPATPALSAPAPAPVPSVEVGAAARVQPFGSPPPARVGPKPRGHGRKPVR